MLQENPFKIKNNQTSVGVSKSPEELVAKFEGDTSLNEVSNKIGFIGSLATAAAITASALSPADNAYARGVPVPVNSQEVARITNEAGIRSLTVDSTIASYVIHTEKGSLTLTADFGKKPASSDDVSEKLRGVTGEQFIREIKRQENVQKAGFNETIQTPSGSFAISFSGYAVNVLKEYGVTYKNGIISNGKNSVDLAGRDDVNPNVSCFIYGWQEFNNYVIADCSEINNGSIRKVVYKIDAATLRGEELKR